MQLLHMKLLVSLQTLHQKWHLRGQRCSLFAHKKDFCTRMKLGGFVQSSIKCAFILTATLTSKKLIWRVNEQKTEK